MNENSRPKFGSTEYKNFEETISYIQPRGTVREFQRDFEKLADQDVSWPQRASFGTPVGSLKKEIVVEVQSARPKTLRNCLWWLE